MLQPLPALGSRPAAPAQALPAALWHPLLEARHAVDLALAASGSLHLNAATGEPEGLRDLHEEVLGPLSYHLGTAIGILDWLRAGGLDPALLRLLTRSLAAARRQARRAAPQVARLRAAAGPAQQPQVVAAGTWIARAVVLVEHLVAVTEAALQDSSIM